MIPDYKDKDSKERTTVEVDGVTGGTRTILEQVSEYLNDKCRYRRSHSSDESDKEVEEGIKWSGVTEHEEQRQNEGWHNDDGLHMDVEHIGSGMLHVEDNPHDGSSRVGGVDAGAGHFLDFSLLDGEHDREKGLRELKEDYHGGDAKRQEHDQQQQQQQARRVDSQSVFSPMVSPLVQPHGSVSGTPYLTADMVHNAQNTPYLQNHVPAPGAVLKDRALFSPLSSPSIVAGEGPRSSSFSLPEASIVLRKGSTASRTKKTPHSTPYMGASGGKVTKSSPLVGPKKTSSTSSTSPKYKPHGWDDMFKLPNSSMGASSSAQYANSTGSSSSDAPKSHSTFATDDSASDYNRSRPATLMNFPKFILPSNTNNRSSTTSNNMVIRATESPVIKPRQVSSTTSMNDLYGDGHSNASSVAVDAHLRKRNSKVYDSNGAEGDLIKKEVHKVAEQGRRNRLNNALLELNSLLPTELKDSVQIPSKATTVELACKYIRELTGRDK